ncbi:hypothetical protein BGW36DRAFT_432251 [Talaromyces proteolyticus]|uniref:Uncharacterized protein n=1 Tax=Talaromyces proteolyticus TaxID=1131652 RepID=A0AAD4KEJ2_9EURO|nr:uncharacterized protein BGW36DRAFT_432251 [Talaromyces proteolyticus]KAH8690449.1 hypothetical protein BGW36DRAFT_432251 [Talaromyces proteolyticus]
MALRTILYLDFWAGCWFCPPGSNGIMLLGWPGLGVYPGGGRVTWPSMIPADRGFCDRPPAGLPTPFPPIKIEPNDYPTNAPTATSESHSMETATQITYYVSYATDYTGSTITTETYSTYSSQVTGCTVSRDVVTFYYRCRIRF